MAIPLGHSPRCVKWEEEESSQLPDTWQGALVMPGASLVQGIWDWPAVGTAVALSAPHHTWALLPPEQGLANRDPHRDHVPGQGLANWDC